MGRRNDSASGIPTAPSAGSDIVNVDSQTALSPSGSVAKSGAATSTEPPSERLADHLKGGVLAVLKNPVVALMLATMVVEAFIVNSFAAFLPLLVQHLFLQTSSNASILVGVVVIPAASAGARTRHCPVLRGHHSHSPWLQTPGSDSDTISQCPFPRCRVSGAQAWCLVAGWSSG